MITLRFRTLGAAALASALILVPTAAHAAGSGAPTPYTVTAQTLTLPAGTTFEANGHINYRVTQFDGSGAVTFNVHQSVPHNGVWPQARYVGQSVYTWTDHPKFAASFPGDYCISWVQVSLFNEHFGEGGQAPVCTTPVVEPTDPVVEPTDPVVEPTDPVVEPTDPVVEPTDPVVDPTDPVVEPTDPVIEPTDPVIDPTDPVIEPTDPVVDPTDPVIEPTDPGVDPTDPTRNSAGETGPVVGPVGPASVAPTDPAGGSDELVVSEVLSAGDPASSARVLAATGTEAWATAALAAMGIAAGAALIVVSRRGANSEPATVDTSS